MYLTYYTLLIILTCVVVVALSYLFTAIGDFFLERLERHRRFHRKYGRRRLQKDEIDWRDWRKWK